MFTVVNFHYLVLTLVCRELCNLLGRLSESYATSYLVSHGAEFRSALFVFFYKKEKKRKERKLGMHLIFFFFKLESYYLIVN